MYSHHSPGRAGGRGPAANFQLEDSLVSRCNFRPEDPTGACDHLSMWFRLALILLLLTPATAGQIVPLPAEQLAQQSEHVFLGRVVKVDQSSQEHPVFGKTYATTVEVVTVWKGSPGKSVRLELHSGGGRGFDIPLEPGATAVFFLSKKGQLTRPGAIAPLPNGYFP